MIEVSNFTKHFGDFVAVDGLSFKVEAGQICGFIGPNGAGKSTTIRFLATLTRSTSGDAVINGFSVTQNPHEVRHSVGYMPEEFGVYEGMTVAEYLDFFGAAYGMKSAQRSASIDKVLEEVDLAKKKGELVQTLSRGMKQRLCFAKSLVHDPPVLILDEPASGLDPHARYDMKMLLQRLSGAGKTILISSHILSELSDLCDTVAIIEHGKLLAHGTLKEIEKQLREHRVIEIVLAEPNAKVSEIFGDFPDVAQVEEFGSSYKLDFLGDNASLAKLNKRLFDAGVEVVTVSEIEGDLEDMFMNITKGGI